MRLAVIFTLAGLALLGGAAFASAWWVRALGFDFGLVCLLLDAAYALNRPGFLFKGVDGRIPLVAWLIYWPYFALNHLSLGWFRVRSGSKAFQPIAGKVWLGCCTGERDTARLAAIPIGATLDLAAEFSETRFLCTRTHYRSLPLLDTRAPTLAQLRDGASFIEREQQQHPILVHCAVGHGRSPCFVLAWLLQTGRTATVEEGLAELQSLRPGVGFNQEQRAVLAAFAAGLKTSRSATSRP
jgi:protein-tyrosine phosphatase